jgi:putative ABC transport system permease protein
MARTLVSSISRLIKSPGLTIVVLISLGLGIGTISAIMGLLNAVLFAPLPYRDPGQLVEVIERQSYQQYTKWNQNLRQSVDFLPCRFTRSDVMVGNERFRGLHGCVVPLESLSVLGVAPFRGGYETGRGSEAIVLSYAAWMKLFGGASAALGSTVIMGGKQHNVVAIMPKDFGFPPSSISDFWLDGGFDFASDQSYRDLNLVMRLKNGDSVASIRAALEALLIHEDEPTPAGRVAVRRLARYPADTVKSGLVFAQVAALVFLLLCCVPVAGLYLLRAERDRQAVSIRIALGASRGRIGRDLAIECMVMIVGVFVSSLFAAWVLVKNLDYLLPPSFNGVTSVIDWRIAAASLGLATVCIGCFGFFPTYRRSAFDSATLLRQDPGRDVIGVIPFSSSLGRLIAVQTAITLVLLIGTVLLVETLQRLWAVPLGFEPEHVMAFIADYPQPRYAGDKERLALDARVRRELEAIPGVQMAGGVNGLPFWGYGYTSVFIHQPNSPAIEAHYGVVTPGFFTAMKVPVLRGRLPDSAGRRKAIINASMASRFWPSEEAIGQTIWRRDELVKIPCEIVAVVGDIHQQGFMTAPQPTVYFDDPLPGMTYVVRTSENPPAFEKIALDALRRIDPGIVSYDFTSMDQVLAKSVAVQRWAANLLGLLGAISYGAALIGMYAFVAYMIRRKTREIAIRLAVGAKLTDILLLILYRTLWPVLAGVIVGLIAAAVGSHYLQSLLFGAAVGRATVFFICTLIVVLTAAAAAGVAFARASAMSPLQALRQT